MLTIRLFVSVVGTNEKEPEQLGAVCSKSLYAKAVNTGVSGPIVKLCGCSSCSL